MQIDNQEGDYVRKYFGEFQAALGEDEDGNLYLYNNYFPSVFEATYNLILESIPFNRADFNKHVRIQEIISEFELDKDAFWNLIVYLYDYVSDACKNLLSEQPSSKDILEGLFDFLKSNETISLTIEASNKKKITVTDPIVLKHLTLGYNFDNLSETENATFANRFLKESDKIDARRKSSYFFADCLISFFGLDSFEKIKRRKGASVSNKEKELILSLLYLCKLMDNPDSYLDTGYFNKLMKDYSGSSLSMSMKYEMSII